MRSNELRTGNIILRLDNESIVDWSTIKLCHQRNKQFNEDWKPIPLTHEWLTKFGFQIRTIDYNLGADNYPCYEIFLLTPFTYDNYLRCNAKLNRWCIIQKIHDSDEEADWCEIMFSLEYVHQLQNLYFALTGKELELKQ